MKIKNIELADISRYRGELMGAAMLFIILFHVQLPRSDMFFGLRRMGNIGVDLFLFLSGIGLCLLHTQRGVCPTHLSVFTLAIAVSHPQLEWQSGGCTHRCLHVDLLHLSDGT